LMVGVLAACTGQGEPASSSDPSIAATSDAGELSPLEEYLGEGAVSFEGGLGVSIFGSSLDQPLHLSEDQLRQRLEAQQLIADCMRDEGFEYIPLGDVHFAAPHDEAWALPADEFTASYGYGISTIRTQVDRPEDPNEAIRESMTPAELEAYQVAMYGEWFSSSEESRGDPQSAEDGCADKATELIFGNVEEYARSSRWEALLAELEALDVRIDHDPRVVDAERSWIACMADEGYPGLDDIGGGQTLLANRIDEVLGIEGSEEHLPWSAADPEALRDLQRYEVDVAIADRACHFEHFGDVFREVRFELEAEFVEQHRDELEQHRERIAEGQ
jgi:hypothetical protein